MENWAEQRESWIADLLNRKANEQGNRYGFEDLATVMTILRGEGGCPWDREQDHKSIRRDFIEETYEVIEAIDTEDPKLLREELGDVLLQVFFHAEIEKEAGQFDVNGVVNDVCEKLIHRHPHVFGNVHVENSEQVLSNWDVIKSEEKKRETVTSKLRSIPPMEPALMRAQKVGKKAACFDFPDSASVYLKLQEEIDEVREAEALGDPEKLKEEMGDVLLTVTSLARKLGVDCEEALYHATNKFIDRFEAVENAVTEDGKEMQDLSMADLDVIWDKVKRRSGN